MPGGVLGHGRPGPAATALQPHPVSELRQTPPCPRKENSNLPGGPYEAQRSRRWEIFLSEPLRPGDHQATTTNEAQVWDVPRPREGVQPVLQQLTMPEANLSTLLDKGTQRPRLHRPGTNSTRILRETVENNRRFEWRINGDQGKPDKN